jgi:hypothetical protein
MSLPFAIEQRLNKEHLAEFAGLSLDHSITHHAAWVWVTSRGYRISASAVSNYIKHARASGLFPLRRLVGLRDDAATRRQLSIWIESLGGEELSSLALFTVYLLSIDAARRGVRLTEIPGTVPMRSKGDRTAK